MDKYYTPQEAATQLKVSVKTVYRIFADEEGVVDLSTRDGKRLLRIPESALNRALTRRRVN